MANEKLLQRERIDVAIAGAVVVYQELLNRPDPYTVAAAASRKREMGQITTKLEKLYKRLAEVRGF